MCETPSWILELWLLPLHFTSTYICRVTIALKVCGGKIIFLTFQQPTKNNFTSTKPLLKFKFATNTPIKIRQPTLLYFFSFSFFKKNKNLLLKISSFFPLSFTLSWFLKKTLLLFMGEKPLILSLFFYFFIILIPSLKKILFCKISFFLSFTLSWLKIKKTPSWKLISTCKTKATLPTYTINCNFLAITSYQILLTA